VERRRLRSALALYCGEFLANRDFEWIAVERERLRVLRLDALFALASAEEAEDDWKAAQATAQLLCAIEPLREDAQRLLMTAHDRCGCRALAITQYRSLVSFLESELGIAPMIETQRLAAQLQGWHSPSAQDPAPPDPRKEALVEMKQKLEASLQLIEAALAS